MPEYENALSVLDAVKVEHPKPKKKAELRFRDDKGGLISDKPDQEEIFPSKSASDKSPSALKPSESKVSPINK